MPRDRAPIITIAYPRCPQCSARMDRKTLHRYGRRHDPASGVDYSYAACRSCGCKVRVYETVQDSCFGKHGVGGEGTMPA